MPDIRRNTSSYKFEVAPEITGTPNYEELKPVTGFSIEDNSTYRTIRALGDDGWQKMLRETKGMTFNITLDYLMDDTDDSATDAHQILIDACQELEVDEAAISVKFTHPAETLVTSGVFTVHGGFPGIGQGGSDGVFNTATYRLVSHGEITTA